MKPYHCTLALVLLLAGLSALCIQVTDQKAVAERPHNPAAAALINSLMDVAEPDTGYSPYVSGSSFAPLSGSNQIHAALLSPSRPAVRSDVVRELVRLGVSAVPDLLHHLGDKRPTRLTVRHKFGGMGGLWINGSDKDDDPKAYTLKVGDLCYVALGQIVNRPYVAVYYQPTAIIVVFTPTRDAETREKLKKEWDKLTPEKHRTSLLKDCEGKGDVHLRSGAFARLAYYYPDALEEPALSFLTQPWYSYSDCYDFVRQKLYKTAERRELFNAYVRAFGSAARDGVREVLFNDLDTLEADEEKRRSPPLKEFGQEPRELLIELFGAPKGVKAKDKPVSETASVSHAAEVIEYGLTYDRKPKIDRAIRGILSKTTDDKLALACMKRLVGRGYDADIEAYYRRRGPAIEEYLRDEFKTIVSKVGCSPLHIAVWRGEHERFAELLREGARVNSINKDGQTPLHAAAAEGNLDAVALLVRAGADQTIKDSQGRTPVAAASFASNTKMVRALVEAGSPIANILVAAAAGKPEEVARFLQTDMASLATKDSHGRTALHLAALEGEIQVMRQLLDGGADVNSADNQGLTPLHFAAALGHEKACRLLIDHDAKVDLPVSRSGARPIHLAAGNGRLPVVRVLVQKGAKADAPDNEGDTPLHYAAERGHLSVVRWLIGQKVYVDAKNNNGSSARTLALKEGHKAVAEFLLANGAQGSFFDDW